jgi:hypothetical protein
MNNLSSNCGLVDARISAYEKDLRKTPLIGAHRGFIGLHASLQKTITICNCHLTWHVNESKVVKV